MLHELCCVVLLVVLTATPNFCVELRRDEEVNYMVFKCSKEDLYTNWWAHLSSDKQSILRLNF